MHDLRKYIKVLESYQEEGSTFSSDGILYDLNQLFALTENHPIAYISTQDLFWLLADYKPVPEDVSRMDNVDLGVPILVTIYEGDKWLIVDGFHRLLRALRDHVTILPCRVIASDMMESSILR
jgi:hypothetical protein